LALQYGLACNTAGGTHHAFPEYGSGFCIFNDLAVASQVLLDADRVKQILIVDLDVHQGDGTAFIFRKNPRVFTFSMHCDTNYPFKKQQSDLDVSLPEGMEDDAYLRTLDQHLPDLLGKVKPDLVLYDAGVDPHASDRLGKLALTDNGIFQRDRMVLEMCVSRRIPVAGVIGGGYSDHIDDLACRHSLLHRAAVRVFEQYGL
jgi:acetoin utilization deacetylase AcuC-like enzyme